MKCPSCDITLSITERQGIEIDYCPSCRGIWLDRGELDKIIERSAEFEAPKKEKKYDHDDRKDREYRHHDDDRKHYDGHHKPYKKKSFLDDLFDF